MAVSDSDQLVVHPSAQSTYLHLETGNEFVNQSKEYKRMLALLALTPEIDLGKEERSRRNIL